MRQSLYHGGNGILRTTIFGRHLVADIHYILPVLRGEILVGCLGCNEPLVSLPFLSRAGAHPDLPTTSSNAFCCARNIVAR